MRRLTALAVGVAVLTIPVAVLATGTEHFDGADFQKYISAGAAQTNSKKWTDVPGLTLNPPIVHGPLTVSAQMTQGRAAFRVVAKTAPNAIQAEPGKVEFDAPASNSFTFYNKGNCVPVTVQWRRLGAVRAKLAKASMHAIWSNGCG